MVQERKLADEAYEKAVEVLKKNISGYGFSASPERFSNYFSVWSRDHSICSLAAILSSDAQLIDCAKKGTLFLFRNQIAHGQVPSYVGIENRKKEYGGLGTITSVDSNMWIVIAAAALYRHTGDKKFVNPNMARRYIRLYYLLRVFDSNACSLLEIPKAGDWADIFNRTYHVLYDECLYYEALRAISYLLESSIEKADDYLKKKIYRILRSIRRLKPRLKKTINRDFWFTESNIDQIFSRYMIYDRIEKREYGYYQSHLVPFKIHWQNRIDLFGNILAMITGIANRERRSRIIRYIRKNRINEPFPMRALYPPVYRNNTGWESIYAHFEKPHTYHNGGIWPVIGGLWIYALEKSGNSRLASRDLLNLAVALKKQGWNFNEYMHGRTGKPMGRKEQAWSAAGYIMGYQSLRKQCSLFTF